MRVTGSRARLQSRRPTSAASSQIPIERPARINATFRRLASSGSEGRDRRQINERPTARPTCRRPAPRSDSSRPREPGRRECACTASRQCLPATIDECLVEWPISGAASRSPPGRLAQILPAVFEHLAPAVGDHPAHRVFVADARTTTSGRAPGFHSTRPGSTSTARRETSSASHQPLVQIPLKVGTRRADRASPRTRPRPAPGPPEKNRSRASPGSCLVSLDAHRASRPADNPVPAGCESSRGP